MASSPRISGLLSAAVLLLHTTAALAYVDLWDAPYAGVRHLHRTGNDGVGPNQSIHVVLVELRAAGVTLEAALNHDTWRGTKEPVSGMARRHGAQVAINGGYWDGGSHDPAQGSFARDGVCFRAHPERALLAWDDREEKVEIGRTGTWPIPAGPPDDCAQWIKGAIGAGPQILFDGKPRWDIRANRTDANHPDINGETFFGSEAWGWGDEREPSTAVGLSRDGRLLILVTCDGRGAGGAAGCRSATDLPALLLEFGAYDGLRLDGGGSTTFFYDGGVRNVPSDGAERPVADALLVHATPADELECREVVRAEAEQIDDTPGCFRREGKAWWATPAKGGAAWFTYADDVPTPASSGRWSFEVKTAGRYDLDVLIPKMAGLSTRAPYTIATSGGVERVPVDQAAGVGSWIRVGTFDLAAGDGWVGLDDATGEPFSGVGNAASRRVVFDRIRLAPEGTPPPGEQEPEEPGETDGDSSSDNLAGSCACRTGRRAAPGGFVVVTAFAWLTLRGGRRVRGRSRPRR